MRIVECLIVALILTVEVVIPTLSPPEATSNLVEHLVKIITSCYGDKINTVGLAGNLPDTLGRTLSVQYLIPITLMDTSHMVYATNVQYVPGRFRYKVPVFIVGASSPEQLANIVQFIMKPSIWWNHMASLFILDQSNGCVNIARFLLIAWQLDFLNAKVMCYHHRYGGYIFNYNPFTSQAPVPWRRANIIRAMNNHLFTVFRQKYEGNEAICMDLDFVKTKDLAGYEIRVEGDSESLKFRHEERRGLSRLLAGRDRILHIIYRALNATPKFTGLNRVAPPHDVEMMMVYAALRFDSISTYPYQQAGIVLITKFRGHKSQLQKILDVIDMDSRIGMGIVYLVTLIFFKFFAHQALVPALLNLVRITSNTGFPNLPTNTAPRMYLTGLLFFVVTIQGIYQGKLAALLTNKIPVRNVNTFEDVVRFDYKIYGTRDMDVFLPHGDVKERFVTTIDMDECIGYVLNDSMAACIAFAQGDTFDDAHQNDLHLSREFLEQVPIGFQIRHSWYLEEQINTVLGTIMEADIFETWESKCNPTKLVDFEFDKEVRKNTRFKIIEFAEVRFAFIILGIGLLCATVTFIVEVAFYR